MVKKKPSFQVRADAKGLWFNFLLADNLPQYVVGDSRKLRQLLTNLLSNAVKFTQAGGVTLRAFLRSTSPLANNRVKLCFEVADTGKGIAEAELDKLFSPFIQTASGIQSQGGTGLGLAISRQFAELMGGTVGVNSIVGEGSVFAFDIQVELADSLIEEMISVSKRVKQLAPGQRNYRLAVVDDQEANRLALVKLLESVGFQPLAANNGKEAISLWQDWQPDLIWMDMRMPVMDGYEATRQIKDRSEVKQAVIIAITASAFEEQREKIINAGCDDFVAKPFTEQVIFDKLIQHLGVKFIYQAESTVKDIQKVHKTNKSLSFRDLAVLSSNLVTDIRQAAIAVDAEQIEQLIAQIPDTQPGIARAISEMLAEYDFDGIIELTEP